MKLNREINIFPLPLQTFLLKKKQVKRNPALPQSDNKKLQTGREELKADNPSAPQKNSTSYMLKRRSAEMILALVEVERNIKTATEK